MVLKIDSPLGPLPEGWILAHLADLTTKIGSGATPLGGEAAYLAVRDKYALIRSQNIFDRKFDSKNLAYISSQDAHRLDGVEVQLKDILLNITGDGITFSRACMVDPTVLPARVNQHVSIIRAKKEILDPGYLLSYLTHPQIKYYMESYNAGGSRRALTKAHIESFVIPLPPIEEQRAIARILGSLDDKIEANRRMNETLEAIARAIFKSWFVDFDPVWAKAVGREPAGMDAETAALFPDSFEETELGMVPKGWMITSFTEAIDVNPPRFLEKGITSPYLEMSNMPTNSARAMNVTSRDFSSGTKYKNGDVLIARITPCLENGKVVFVDFLEEGQIGWGSTEYIVTRSHPPLPLVYAYFLARFEDFRSFLITNMTGTSGRQRVPTSCLSGYDLVIPSEKICSRFSDILRPIMAAIKRHDEESQCLVALRNVLLPKLLSGGIRINEKY